MIMSILSGNLTEGQKTTTAPPVKVPVTISTVTETKVLATSSQFFSTREEPSTSHKTSEEKVHIFLKFNFTMESFIIDLYTGAAATVTLIIFFYYQTLK